MNSFSHCHAGLGYAFACFGGSAAGLGSIFECTGGSEMVSSSTFEGHGRPAAFRVPRWSTLVAPRGARAASSERSEVILGSLVAPRRPEGSDGHLDSTMFY